AGRREDQQRAARRLGDLLQAPQHVAAAAQHREEAAVAHLGVAHDAEEGGQLLALALDGGRGARVLLEEALEVLLEGHGRVLLGELGEHEDEPLLLELLQHGVDLRLRDLGEGGDVARLRDAQVQEREVGARGVVREAERSQPPEAVLVVGRGQSPAIKGAAADSLAGDDVATTRYARRTRERSSAKARAVGTRSSGRSASARARSAESAGGTSLRRMTGAFAPGGAP